MNNLKIIFIDDHFSTDMAIMILLKEQYGDDNVLLFKQPDEGLQYIVENVGKTVVFLDWEFGKDLDKGFRMFRQIYEKTSLVYVIMMTVKQTSLIEHEKLVELINHHAMGFIDSSVGISIFLEQVEKAERILSTRLDCALEEWILNHPDDTFNNPYMTTRSGRTYTLNQVLAEIRQGTKLGTDLQKNVLLLAIDLLTRNKKQIDD